MVPETGLNGIGGGKYGTFANLRMDDSNARDMGDFAGGEESIEEAEGCVDKSLVEICSASFNGGRLGGDDF